MECIFSIALDAEFKEVTGVFLTKNIHQTLTTEALDVMLAFDVCWSFDAAHVGHH